MSRRARLMLIWAVLAVLAAVIVLGERQRSAQVGESTRRETPWLLPVPIAEIGIVEIMIKGAQHRFERDAQSRWFYHGTHDAQQAGHAHTTDPAQAELIDKAMVVFGRIQREQKLALPEGKDEYGVTRPEIFLMVYRPGADTPLARYAVGIVATDGVSRYVLPIGSADVVTIPDFHIKNLLALVDAVGKTGARTP